ncbi:MAG: polysaccharide biosynthesis tyrosine autokinase [Synechococcales bacterium]|nr:polysaccharide biosynthesis tyrosine autokinase [Synechococcales bacterium]
MPSRNPEAFDVQINPRQIWRILRRRWIPIASAVGVSVALGSAAALSQQPTYEAEGTLQISSDQVANLIGVLDQLGLEGEAGGRLGSAAQTEALVLRSQTLLEDVVVALDLRNEEGELRDPAAIARNLTVRPVGSVDALRIAYTSPDPQVAAAVVNELISQYTDRNVQENRSEAVAAREFIETQLPKVESRLETAESNLRRFKEENQIVSIEEESEAVANALDQLNSEISTQQAQLSASTGRLEFLEDQVGLSPEAAIRANAVSQTPGVQAAVEELQQVEVELATALSRFTEASPIVEELREEQRRLTNLLGDRLDDVDSTVTTDDPLQSGEGQQDLRQALVEETARRNALQNAVDTLSQQQRQFQDRANVLPQLEQRQQELTRRLEAARVTYQTLLSRLQDIQVAENQNIGNVRVIDRASVPQQPNDSKAMLYPIAAGGMGLILGVAIALLIELLDPTIKTVKETREIFGYPLLGKIPRWQPPAPDSSGTAVEFAEIPVLRSPFSPVSLSYRMLQTNLKFLSSDQPLRVINITSPTPGEGKSTVAANLAASLADLSHRVLLIEADMRCPRQHQIWRLGHLQGLSNVLVDETELTDAIQFVNPHLDVLAGGILPPSPMALLDSNRMNRLLRDLGQTYDYILLDAPPLLAAPDAYILGKIADGTLLVVRPDQLHRDSATEARDGLLQSGLRVSGMVINGVAPDERVDSFYTMADRGGRSPQPQPSPLRAAK